MAARQLVIIGGITLAAVLTGVLWYQLSTTPASKTATRTSPTPRPSAAAQFVNTTPTPTLTPAAETSATQKNPTVLAVQTSAKTGPAETAIVSGLLSAILGGTTLGYTIKRALRRLV